MPPRLARGRLGPFRWIAFLVAPLVGAGSIFCPAGARAQLTWDIQTADSDQNSGWSTSLRLSAAGLPRVAEWAPGAGVRFASYDGSSWSVETLPPPSASDAIEVLARVARGRPGAPAHTDLLITTATALALDASGDPWIVSAVTNQRDYNPAPIALSVAHRTGGSWTTESIAPGFDTPSIEFDASGRLHLCFDAGTPLSHTLEYAVCDAGLWTYETVDAHGSVGVLKLDGQGVPHLAYWDWARGALVHAFRTGPSAWDTTTVPNPTPVGSWSLALGPEGRPLVAVTSGYGTPPDQTALRCFEQQADGSWTIDVVDGSPGGKSEPSLALDPAGDPVIAYNDQGALDLKFALRKGGAWSNQIVDAIGNTGYYTSVAVDAHARPVVSFQTDAGPVDMRVAFGSSTVSVEPAAAPASFRLVAVRPNPARVGTPLSLTLTLPAGVPVSLEAFDASGRRVATRAPQAFAAGVTSISWDAPLHAPGLYVLRARAGEWHATTKLAVTK